MSRASAVAERASPYSEMTSDLSQSHFALFGLDERFDVDEPALEEAYILLQKRFHPDRYASLPDHERRAATQWSMRINEGYQTLKDQLSRAIYMLSIRDVQLEENPFLPPDFLMTQMTLREALEEIEQSAELAELDRFKNKLRKSVAEQCNSLRLHFEKDSTAGIKSAIYALQFLKKLERDMLRLEDRLLDD